jgi:endonuclease YncB( thermonuclease family)
VRTARSLVNTLVAALATVAGAETLEGRVVAVHDGDTLTLLVGEQTTKVRIAEIDTPESGQPWGKRSKQALAARVFGKPVRVIEVDVDAWGRTIGEVYADDVCVGCELVREGHAWVYRRFSDDAVLLELEAEARARGAGLWSLPESQRIPPWEWRHRDGHRAERPPAQAHPTCGAKQTCKQMGSCAEARFHLEECGLTDLDGDADGVPCESLCSAR